VAGLSILVLLVVVTILAYVENQFASISHAALGTILLAVGGAG